MNAGKTIGASGMIEALPIPFPATAAHTDGADDDMRLVVRAQQDPHAFAALYDRYVTRVYGYCYRRLGSREAAEDATSLVFSRVLTALPRFATEGGTFRSWLFTIAHHAVVDARRARREDWPLSAAAAVVDPAPDPEDEALAADEVRAFRALLVHLTPEQAQVVELRLAGLTDVEIARVLGRSHGAVRAAQHRALIRLRAVLGVEPPGGHDA
jgi:RNA polymerase sigma-70 factor (ECF subfamily)